MNTGIFRKVSLERLSSPEQLDQLMKITNPRTWISIITIFVVIFILIIWGFAGRIPYNVTGQGILMKSGGIINITNLAAGTVSEITVSPGSIVEKGDVVARINQPDLINQLSEAMVKLQELEQERSKFSNYSSAETGIQLNYFSQEEINSQAVINSDSEQLAYLVEKIKTLEDLQKEGGISKQTVDDTKAKYESLKQKIFENKNNLSQIKLKKNQTVQQQDKESVSAGSNIAELKRKIASLEDNINFYSNVVAPYTGKVIEVMVNEDSLINAGTTVMSLEPTGKELKNLEAVIYVPFQEGKRIAVGMTAQVTPSVIKKEESGFIYGRVTSVADYPSTSTGMMRFLGNDNLIRTLTNSGPSIEIHIDLIPTSKTFSGFKWSTRGGPKIKLETGTLCSGDIVVEEQPPANLVIPMIKKLMGL